MCGAATITVAEVEELVKPGELDPNHIHIPGIFVHRIFQGKNYEKRIEQEFARLKKRSLWQDWFQDFRALQILAFYQKLPTLRVKKE